MDKFSAKTVNVIKILLFLLTATVIFSSCSSETDVNSQNGIWITYYELNDMLKNKETFKTDFEKAVDNIRKTGIKNLYIHTRAFGENLYLSDYFPLCENVKNYNYDVFEFIVQTCKKFDLKIYAWINPYRIASSDCDIDKINHESPAYKWLTDKDSQNDANVGFSNGIYLNPAEYEVKKLLTDGIYELICKYDIDGIHFDDYFYPTDNEDFDKISFENYLKKTDNPLSLSDWRRNNVTDLIKSCYEVIKNKNENIIFSISPAASIEKNYEKLFADVEKWIENGYLDEVIPQLYFGFEYPDDDFKFENLLSKWKTIKNKNKNVALKIGLGAYKAKSDSEADKEWKNDCGILARQAEMCDNDIEVCGYVLFSYSSLFGDEKEFKLQREIFEEYLKTGF